METFLSPFCWSCWPLCLMQIEYQFPPGGRYTKVSSPKGPMAGSWQEVGQGGVLMKLNFFFLPQHSTFHQWMSFGVCCCQGSLTTAVAILGATSKTPLTPAIFFRDRWPVRNSRNPSTPKQGVPHHLIMSLLPGEWLGTFRQDVVTSQIWLGGK